jgi:hypothetical protein
MEPYTEAVSRYAQAVRNNFAIKQKAMAMLSLSSRYKYFLKKDASNA